MKIYVIGPPGSGKTTLAKKLAQKYKTKMYELDCLVYDDEHDHVKRSEETIQALFDDIIKGENWIIEDVGRRKFFKGLEQCDTIYYLKIPKMIIFYRIIKRWYKQRLGKEEFNYPPTIHQLLDMIKVAMSYYQKESSKLNNLQKYSDKFLCLNQKDIKKMFS